MSAALSFWWGFAAGLLTGIAATCAGGYLAARWLARHVPITGPVDTALTPVELSRVTIDPRGPEIPLAPETRRALTELPSASFTHRPDPTPCFADTPWRAECDEFGHCRCWARGEECCGCGVTAGPGKAYNDGR